MSKSRLTVQALLLMSVLQLSTNTAGALAPAELLAFQRAENALIFGVISTGCTQADDFQLNVSFSDDSVTSLTLVRLKKDRCRMVPRQKQIEIVLDTVDLQKLLHSPVLVENPFTVLRPLKRQ